MKTHAFTLVELVVVIFVVLILAALIFPAIQGAMINGKQVATMNNGVNIYKAVFSAAVDAEVAGKVAPWPKYSTTVVASNAMFHYANEYFAWLVTNDILQTDCSFLSAPGVAWSGATASSNIDTSAGGNFTGSNNAWCAVGDLDDSSPDATPFIFTRNVAGIADGMPLNAIVPLRLTNVAPYGLKGILLINKGGAGFVLKGRQLATMFNSSGATNRILMPGP